MAQPASLEHAEQIGGEDPLARLDAFLGEPEQFDEECLRPTEYAVRTARALLSSVSSREPQLPSLEPVFSTIGDGSLYIRWRCEQRELRVLIPPADTVPVRAYFRDGAQDAVDVVGSPDILRHRLNEIV